MPGIKETYRKTSPNGFDYVVIKDLPEIQANFFRPWLNGQTMPIIEEENENKTDCAYFTDYERFLDDKKEQNLNLLKDIPLAPSFYKEPMRTR